MLRLLLAFLFAAITFLPVPPAIATQDIEMKITKLENKVAKKFSKTFCNSTGFGISDEGALRFSLGETKGEYSKNPLRGKVNLDKIKDQILIDIADSCYYYELTKNDLDGLTLDKDK